MKNRRRPRRGRTVCDNQRLRIEWLERRDLLAVMRVVDWNTLNGPNDATGDANFSTVLQAIGNETVQGNAQRIDVLALQETDPAGAGGNSIGRITGVLNSAYGTSSYQYVISAEDGGGDSTGFVYDTATVSLLNSYEFPDVDPDPLNRLPTHTILRAKFHPVGYGSENDFYVYSIHLKSGDTGADASKRNTEAALLRADADALGEGANVLFVGDFNMQGSSEAAYTTFVSAGAGQLQDVADAPGAWNNNPAFKSLHTQDPRTTMDDRFDIQFASGEFFNNVGLDYVSNSYHVFGNNGTHTLDMPITTGTGASADVLNALVAASDHLPVVADYQIITSTPNVRITQTLGGTRVVEGGLYDTYHIVLDTVPAADVTVTVTPDAQVDVGNGAGVAKVFTFTAANALTPQTVVVHAADDAVGEGDHSGVITHTSASSDISYNGLAVAAVNVAIVDNDTPKIVINELDSDQNATDIAEFIELYDGGVGNVPLTGYVVVFYNGGDPNNASYLALDLAGKQTNANGFFVLGNAAVVPTPGLIFANNTLQNGADAVALYLGTPISSLPNGTPPTTVNLRDAVVYDTSDPDDTGLLAALTPGQPQIDENGNGAGISESIARVPDGGTPLQTTTYVAQAPTPGTFNTTYPSGMEILQSNSRIDVAEGGTTDSYQIALQSIPTANVQITVDPDDQIDLGAGAGVAIVLTFTPNDALIPQTVNVAAVNDLLVQGSRTGTITHTASSADSKYNSLALGNVSANIADNDIPPPPSIAISEIMYNPASDETSPGVGEWIEVVNTGSTATDLGGWLFDDEDATDWGSIPAGTLLQPHQVAVFFDSDFTTAATFRTEWNVPSSALVVGITWGSFSNTPGPGNEVIQLLSNLGDVMDVVNYDDTAPWPSAAEGPSIYLKNLALDDSNGANWARSVVGSSGALSPTGPTFVTTDVGSPGRVPLAGDYNGNGGVDAADYIVWRKTLGSTTDLRADGSGATPGVPNGVVDQFDYTFWRATFGVSAGTGTGAGGVSSAGGTLAAASVLPAMSTSSDRRECSIPTEATVRGAAVTELYVFLDPASTPEITNRLQPAASAVSTPSESFGSAPLLNLFQAIAQKIWRAADDPTFSQQDSTEVNGDACDELFSGFAGQMFNAAI